MVFYMSTCIAIIVIPIIYKLDIQVKKNEHTMLKTAKNVMGMIDVDIFLIAEIFLGFCWGFHMNFISVYILTELESSKTLFGKDTKENLSYHFLKKLFNQFVKVLPLDLVVLDP